jgi:uracil-DNA glycosylase
MEANPKLNASWLNELKDEFKKDYFKSLKITLTDEINDGKIIFPPGELIFNAFDLTPFEKVKVIILGQDPYHGPKQAHGLSFSVPEGIKRPPSLVNIYKELKSDLNIDIPEHGNLTHWAQQGVLLLNSALTVIASKPGSHQKIGWNIFSNEVINMLSSNRENLVFMLWGNFAKSKASLIDSSKHLVLNAAHPSPLSAYNGFFGCKHFSKANEYLRNKGAKEIDWTVYP